MHEPAIPSNEEQRIVCLENLNVLDTPAEERFDQLTRLAQKIFQVPIVLISLIDRERQWFKSKQGLDADETPRTISFCGHAILQNDIFIVCNALEDERFYDNPLVVSEPNIRFYAGCPLEGKGGYKLGTLCLIDSKVRSLNNQQLDIFRELAQLIEEQLNMAKENREILLLNLQLKETVRQLELAKDELIHSEKMASLGRLVTGFAHEINTPIGIALTAVTKLDEIAKNIKYMLTLEEVEEEDLEEALNKISPACELATSNLLRAGRLVTSFKRTSVDQNIEDKTLFCIHDVIEDVIVSLGSRFHNTNIEIENRCSPEINMYSYPGIISQVLINLMLNSLLHGFDNGKMAGKITIDIQKHQHEYQLIYTDNGVGIKKEVQKNIFEPFFTTKRAQGGTGLGMYVCYNLLVNKLQGNLSCKSIPGKGVTFHVTIPIEQISQK